MRIQIGRVGLAAVLAGFLTGGAANAAFVVDQSQLVDNAELAQFSFGGLAQSFQQAAGNIAGAAVKIKAGTGTADVTISLYDALPNAGGNLLASGTDFGVSIGEFAQVTFGVVPVTPDTTYFLVFTAADDDGNFGLAGNDQDVVYARGQAYANAGFMPFPTLDYTFQTFTETDTSPGTPVVPAPPALVALLGGAAGLIGLRRFLRACTTGPRATRRTARR